MAQEKMDSWWEYARELAKAERELKIEKWVYISIEYKEENGERIVLYHYDLPRELHERYRWVIRWREAKLLCQYPKKNIHTYYSYYDKRTGLNTDFNSLLSKLTSTKAQITIAERKEQEYLQYQRQNNLFFDELNSTCKCNRILINNLFKFFVWREVSKSFTRSIIEFIFNPLNLFVGYFTKVLTLWDILPDKPVGVFIGTTFP